jgi:hypothetical protein
LKEGEVQAFKLLDHDSSPEARKRRSRLYLVAYCLLALSFQASLAGGEASQQVVAYQFGLALLTGTMALVLRLDPASIPFRSLWRPESKNAAPARITEHAAKLDRIVEIRAERRGFNATSLSEAFPPLDATSENTALASRKPQSQSTRTRDPFSNVLADLSKKDTR